MTPLPHAEPPLQSKRYQVAIGRRFFGAVIAVTPIALGVFSIVLGHDGKGIAYQLALWLMGFAVFITFVNLWLSCRVVILTKVLRKNPEGISFVSGIPILGSCLALLAVLLGFGSMLLGAGMLFCALFDTGGLTCFIWSTWKDRGFWDREVIVQPPQNP